jgi:aspartate aminotransferase
MDPRVSQMAGGLIGSEILRIAADVRALAARGARICNLTVGDFDPRQFPAPEALVSGVVAALHAGETNYPPSDGMPELRRAVVDFYRRRLGLEYPVESILVTGGSRPGIYATYRTLVDPGDAVIYPVPSWNNNHYCHLVGARGVPVHCDAADSFLPTRAALEPLVRDARLLVVNSPLNPAGTAFRADVLADICDLVLEENARRGPEGRPLFLMYDQVYWMLTFGDTQHADPVSLRPAMRDYTVYVDGASKAFSATGVRVGWTAGPPDITRRMASLLGHVGAWAPRAEQVAVAHLLNDDDAMVAYHDVMRRGVQERLDALHDGMQALHERGFPVEAIVPMGAIYLSVRLGLHGWRTPDGMVLTTNDDIRRHLLEAAGVAIVPFQAFGMADETGWFRLSVGAVSMQDIEDAFARRGEALAALQPATAAASA